MEVLAHVTYANVCEPAVYMSYMSKNVHSLHASNLSVQKHSIFSAHISGVNVKQAKYFVHHIFRCDRM